MGTDLSGSTVLQCRAVLQCSELKWSVVDWGASNSLHCFYSIDCITLIALHCFHSSDCIALHSFHWLHCTSHLALHCSKCIALLVCELQCIEKLLCVHTANEDSFCSAGQLDWVLDQILISYFRFYSSLNLKYSSSATSIWCAHHSFKAPFCFMDNEQQGWWK